MTVEYVFSRFFCFFLASKDNDIRREECPFFSGPIELCSAEARFIISTVNTKFQPVAIFVFAYITEMAANR